MANLNAIQRRLLETIENEIDLLIQLRRKYNLGFKLYTRMGELLVRQEAIIRHHYWLERRNLEDNRCLVIAYFEDGSFISFYETIETIENKTNEIG